MNFRHSCMTPLNHKAYFAWLKLGLCTPKRAFKHPVIIIWNVAAAPDSSPLPLWRSSSLFGDLRLGPLLPDCGEFLPLSLLDLATKKEKEKQSSNNLRTFKRQESTSEWFLKNCLNLPNIGTWCTVMVSSLCDSSVYGRTAERTSYHEKSHQ